MKRPLWLLGSSFLIAIRVAFLFNHLSALLVSIALFLAALLFYLLKSKTLTPVCLVLFACSIGFAGVSYYISANIIPFEEHKGTLVEIDGIVSEVYSSSQRSTRYTITADFPKLKLPRSTIVIRDYLSSELKAGDRFSTVINFGNPKYMATKAYYDRQGIPGEGVLLEAPLILHPATKDKALVWLIKYRQKVYSKANDIFFCGNGCHC